MIHHQNKIIYCFWDLRLLVIFRSPVMVPHHVQVCYGSVWSLYMDDKICISWFFFLISSSTTWWYYMKLLCLSTKICCGWKELSVFTHAMNISVGSEQLKPNVKNLEGRRQTPKAVCKSLALGLCSFLHFWRWKHIHLNFKRTIYYLAANISKHLYVQIL